MNTVKNNTKEFLDIYVTTVCDPLVEYHVLHETRDKELCAISNERVKREKYSAWLLLERAVKESLGLSMDEAELTKDKSGKWISPHFYLSISHCTSLVTVAISHAPVGIDIELLGKERPVTFAKKNLNQRELDDYFALGEGERDEFLLTRWCAKEAIFKKDGGALFIPSSVDSYSQSIISKTFSYGFEKYAAVVSTDTDIKPRFIDLAGIG